MSRPSTAKKARREKRKQFKMDAVKYINTLFQLKAAGTERIRFRDGKVFSVEALIQGLKNAAAAQKESKQRSAGSSVLGGGIGAGIPDAGVPEVLDGISSVGEEEIVETPQRD